MKNAEVLVKFKGDTNDLDKKTDKAESSLSGFANVAAKGFKIAAAAVTATATAVGVLVKKSVEGYAEFEQLEGGLISLFGEGSKEMQQILTDSETAYKDLTLSQNDYLTAFQSSYPLVNAGLSKNADAIEYTNKVLQLSSDLFNTYGGSTEYYSNAINWALKGSFVYLDNLNLGIKGTQEGFIEAANASGILGREIQSVKDLTNDEIIDVIQHYAKEYGVWGKTAAEAGDTILGSLNMTKAAWSNFVTGLSKDGADIDKLVNELVNSAITFGDNVLPVIETALGSIVDALPGVVDKIVTKLPGLLDRILPGLIESAINLINGLVQALPDLIPTLAKGIVQAVQGLVKVLPTLIDALIKAVIMIIQALAEAMPDLIPALVEAILEIIPVIIENLPLFIKAGFQLLTGLIQGIIQCRPQLLKGINDINKSIINYLKQLPQMVVDIGVNIVKGLWNGIKNSNAWLIGKVKDFAKGILKGIKSVLGIHSPSTETAWMAEMMGLGMTNELERIAPEIQRTINSTFSFDPTMTNAASLNMNKNITVYNNIDMKQDPLGQMVSDIKTFSGGAKNDYNYGMS